MLDEATRTAILKLKKQGHGSRKIAKALGVGRDTVRRVISSGSAAVPALVRDELADPYREQILELHAQYQGHLGRVHEKLLQAGATLSYPALTAFCRRHGIGTTPAAPAGHYTFTAGSEMQPAGSTSKSTCSASIRRKGRRVAAPQQMHRTDLRCSRTTGDASNRPICGSAGNPSS